MKMIFKDRTPHIRHVSQTRRANLDSLNLDSNISVTYLHTHQQITDILTEGSFSRDKWNDLMILFGIVPASFSTEAHFSVVAALV